MATKVKIPTPVNTDKPKLSTYVSTFTVTLGPWMKVTGKLVNVRRPKDKSGSFTNICPDCNEHGEPTALNTGYVCNNPNHTMNGGALSYGVSEVSKAKLIGDTLVPVDPDEVKAAKKSDLPLNVFSPTVHPVESIRSMTWADDNAYVLIPSYDGDEAYGLLVRLIGDSGRAFIGLCNLRNNESLFRLDVWNGHIVLQKIVLPSECNIIDGPVVSVDDKTFKLGVKLLETVATDDFDPVTYKTTVSAKLAAMNDELAKLAGSSAVATVSTSTKPAVGAKSVSLADQLAAFLAENEKTG